MAKTRLRLLLVFAVSMCVDRPAIAQDPLSARDCQAAVFVLDSFKLEPSVASPDSVRRIQLSTDGQLEVFEGAHLLGRIRIPSLSAGLFLKWAPDSRRFYVMWSDGGLIGNYHLRLYAARHSLRRLAGAKIAEKTFARRHHCKARGNNTYALNWVGPDRLLVMTEVYPTGDCGPDSGHDEGYLVRVSDGRILQHYEAGELKLAASCPTRIWPTALWNETDLEKAERQLQQAPH